MDKPPAVPLQYPPSTPPALTLEQQQQIAAARRVFAKIRRAGGVATADGWTTGILGALTMLLSFGSIVGIVMGAGMVIVSYRQLRSAKALTLLDATAPAKLAQNQMMFGTLLFLYGAYSVWTGIRDPNLLGAVGGLDAESREMLAPYTERIRALYIAVYASLMAVAVVGAGLTALYYRTRLKYLQTYVRDTPEWIAQLQQAGFKL